MKIPLLILLNFVSCLSFGQALTWEAEDLENAFYYPSKKNYSNNKIKFRIDSNVYQLPRGYWVEAFDQKGRIIGSFSRSVDSFVNPYRYIELGDTLLRVRVTDKDSIVYMIERFIYNSKGQIILFDRFYNDFTSIDMVEFYRTIFFYSNDKVTDKLLYSLRKRTKLTTDSKIQTDSMKLWSSKHYSYYSNKANLLTIVQENIGDPEFRDIDTFTYSIRKKILRHTNFAKNAYLFCRFRASNVRRIENYEYKGDSVFIQSYTTTAPNFSTQSDVQYLDYKIKIYSKQGLETRNFHGSAPHKIEIYDRIKYIYY